MPLTRRLSVAFAWLVCAAACADDAKPVPLPKGAAARLNEAAFQDGSPIHALAVFPDGKRFATLNQRELRVWDATGQLVESVVLPAMDLIPEIPGPRTLPPGRGWGLALTTDGSAIYAMRPKMIHSVPFPNAGKELTKLPIGDSAVSIVPYGKTGVVAHTRGGSLYRWDHGQAKWELAQWRILSFSNGSLVHGGGIVAGGPFDEGVVAFKEPLKHVELYDTNTDKKLGPWRTGDYANAAISGDGKRIALATRGSTATTTSEVEVRSVADFTKVRTWDSKSLFLKLALSPSGKAVAFTTTGNKIAVYNVDSGDHVRDLDCDHALVSAVAFLGEDAVIGVCAVKGRSAIRVWDVKTGKDRSPERVGPIRALAPLPNGAWASGSADGRVTVWEPNKPPRDLGKHEFGAYAVAAPADGKTVYSGGGDSVLRAWDVATGKERHAATFSRIEKREEASASIYALAVSGDGKEVLAASGKGWLRTHDARDLKVQRELWPKSGIPGLVGSVGFAANGEIVASDEINGVRVWDATGETSRLFAAHGIREREPTRMKLAVSPDGTLASRPLSNEKPIREREARLTRAFGRSPPGSCCTAFPPAPLGTSRRSRS